MLDYKKTLVFISCGQKDGSKEREVASKIQERIKSLGYEAYLAFDQHSVIGLIDDIFYHLYNSEYVIFIDFKREQLSLNERKEIFCRGSLYTNQELAIAIYLKKKIIPFQQEGVLKLDGMLSTSILNPISFKDDQIDNLPDLITEQIRKENWSNDWKNKIEISVKNTFDDVGKSNGDTGRHYHLIVKNLHKDKIALNCTAYIKSIKNVSLGQEIKTDTVELKWAGSLIPNVSIMPESHRLLDAFFVYHSNANALVFPSYSDSPM